MNLHTEVIEADRHVADYRISIAPPLHMTTTFRSGNSDGYTYSRDAAPTRSRVEAVLGKIDGGFASTYASGLAAIYAVLRVLRPKRILYDFSCPGGYHKTRQILDILRADGVEIAPLGELAATPLRSGDCVYLECPNNPTLRCYDIRAWSAKAHAAGGTVVVDGTLASGLQLPLKLGADAVVHSATKYLGGHSDILAGVAVVSKQELHTALLFFRSVSGGVIGSMEV
eukprot:TRINITY_DN8159_c0_g1_i4.p1 TRINITY_DN8159_c0_g1~~TRINITY_DN8159_c0_g1_i4.p1  ORF type:complete len:238 (+),score=51.96 TRINITY_DN8159_c0_g1_i4:36-716(+)